MDQHILNRDFPSYGPGGGRFSFGAYINPGAKMVALVKATGGDISTSGTAELGGVPVVKTLEQALKQCRPGYGDVVGVLPGHSESVIGSAGLAQLKAGTRIIGLGGDPDSTNAPVFRWTATTSEWMFDVADVVIAGLKLRLEGANGVVLPFDVNAAGVKFIGNSIETASGATAKCTQIADIDAAAHDFGFFGNFVHGTETHNSINGITMTGANLRAKITGNMVIASFTAGNGFMNITGAVKRLVITKNVIYNTHTASTSAITINNAAADGLLDENRVMVVSDAAINTTGIILTAFAGRLGLNYHTDGAAGAAATLRGALVT